MMTNSSQQGLRRRVSKQLSLRAVAHVLCRITCITMLLMAGHSQLVYGQDTTAAHDLGLLRFESSGRVRLDVEDPNGNTVNRLSNEIDGAVIDSGDHAVSIEIPNSIQGDYQLDVNVSGSVNRLQRFSVWVTNGVDTIHLAEEELIVNVPTDAYVIRNSASGIELVTQSEDDNSGMSNTLMWILVGSAGLLVGIALFIVRSRKRKV